MANNEPYRKRIVIEDKITKIMTEVQVFTVIRRHRKEAETLTWKNGAVSLFNPQVSSQLQRRMERTAMRTYSKLHKNVNRYYYIRVFVTKFPGEHPTKTASMKLTAPISLGRPIPL